MFSCLFTVYVYSVNHPLYSFRISVTICLRFCKSSAKILLHLSLHNTNIVVTSNCLHFLSCCLNSRRWHAYRHDSWYIILQLNCQATFVKYMMDGLCIITAHAAEIGHLPSSSDQAVNC
jgi:hypothetical protein